MSNTPNHPIHRALVTYVNEHTGEIRVKVPSLTGLAEVSISYVGRKPYNNVWAVPSVGDQIVVTGDDQNFTNLFWVQTDIRQQIEDVQIYTQYEIGDVGPAGGIIFITPETTGNSTGKYFEVARDVSERQRSWAQTPYVNVPISNALSPNNTAIGTGMANTTAIINQGNTDTSIVGAAYCAGLNLNGYQDWFLPSLEELKLVQKNVAWKYQGGFARNQTYSSSSELYSFFTGNASQRGVRFTDNPFEEEIVDLKSASYYVRAVRMFGLPTNKPLSGDVLSYNGTNWTNSKPVDNVGLQYISGNTVNAQRNWLIGPFTPDYGNYDSYRLIITGYTSENISLTLTGVRYPGGPPYVNSWDSVGYGIGAVSTDSPIRPWRISGGPIAVHGVWTASSTNVIACDITGLGNKIKISGTMWNSDASAAIHFGHSARNFGFFPNLNIDLIIGTFTGTWALYGYKK